MIRRSSGPPLWSASKAGPDRWIVTTGIYAVGAIYATEEEAQRRADELNAGRAAGGDTRMLAGESPVQPCGSVHETKGAPPATSPAETLLYDTRIRLAFLQRYADRLAALPEGGIYLRLLAETAEQAVTYAEAHCSRSGTPTAPPLSPGSSGTAPAGPPLRSGWGQPLPQPTI